MRDATGLIRRLTIAALAMILSGAFIWPQGAFANSETTLTVSRGPAEFVLGDPSNPGNSFTLSVRITGKVAGNLEVGFVDYVTSGSARQTLPAGSTNTSLAKVLKIGEFDGNYTPELGLKTITLTLSGKKQVEPRIYSGGISIRFTPSNPSGASGSSSRVGVTHNMLAVPFGVVDLLPSDVAAPARVLSHEITSLTTTDVFSALLPDLPGLLNSTPATSKVLVKNGSQLPLFIDLHWVFYQSGELLTERKVGRQLLGIGSGATFRFDTLSEDSSTGRKLNVLPQVGFVDYRVEVSSGIGGHSFSPWIEEGTLLVFPWKVVLPLVLFVWLSVWLVIRRFRTARNRLSTNTQTAS